VIRHVREFSGREGVKLKLFIKLPAKDGVASGPARHLERT